MNQSKSQRILQEFYAELDEIEELSTSVESTPIMKNMPQKIVKTEVEIESVSSLLRSFDWKGFRVRLIPMKITKSKKTERACIY